MNRSELVGEVRRSMVGIGDLPADVLDAILEAVIQVVLRRARAGQKTAFSGLGYFRRATIAARPYLVPVTLEPIEAEEKNRLIFMQSAEVAGLLSGEWAGRSKMQHGRAEVMQAALRACDALDETRRRMLNNAGVLCWACDGDGAAGRGAWAWDELSGWRCASGNSPFLALDATSVEMALDFFESAVKVAMLRGLAVDLRGFGVWYVKNRPAKRRNVPVWTGGSEEVDCPAKRAVSFSAYVRL